MARDTEVCREIRTVTGGYIVEVYEFYALKEYIFTTWDAVLSFLTSRPSVQQSLPKPPYGMTAEEAHHALTGE